MRTREMASLIANRCRPLMRQFGLDREDLKSLAGALEHRKAEKGTPRALSFSEGCAARDQAPGLAWNTSQDCL